MRRHYRNGWSAAAACMMAIAHTRAPMIRWLLLAALVLVWASAGFLGWYGGSYVEDGAAHVITLSEAIYRTVGALSMSDIYIPRNEALLNVARFAGLAIPVVGLLFAFWGELGRSLAQGLHQFASHHIVIAGAGPAAVNLAQDCRALRQGGRDSVVLVGAGLPEDLAWSLRRNGVFVIDAAGADRRTLKAARADHAAHVVAFEEDDTANLQIEAAMRGLLQGARRDPPLAVHVATRSAMLLREARAMNSARGAAGKLAIEAKPFSLDEIAARRLVQSQTMEMLDLAAELNQPRVHIVCFGFDEAARAVASHVFMSLWSARFEPPRVTVLTRDVEAASALFEARHPQARAHPHLWAADIAFLPFDPERRHIDTPLLEEIEAARGAATAIVVSIGADPENIRLALAVKRACNQNLFWPVPVYMKESAQSEFSAIYAKGDETAERDAYLLAFGGLQTTATRKDIIRGELDRGAAIAHTHYQKGLASAEGMNMRDLQAATKDWSGVHETYRAANRAAADAAMVKVWDAGWRPMAKGKGETAPQMDSAMLDQIARREHDRWMAERLMSGWRPSEKRDNALLMHDKLVPWEALNENDKNNDRTQVRAAIDIARVMHPRGFEQRG